RGADADIATLVGRSLIRVVALLRPAVLVGCIGRDLQRPLWRLIRRPTSGNCRIGVLGAHVDDHDARVTLGRLDNRRWPARGDAPASGCDESVAERRGL